MKKIFTFLTAIAMVFGLSLSAHATLYNRGTDTLGNRLIYDDDLNITWYDYTRPMDYWQNQVNWADALSVNFGGTIYNDWRLPSTVDGPWVWGYDGTTTGGYNVTSSELGHLFYTELGNVGYLSTNGTYQSGFGVINTGDFQNLNILAGYNYYWSGTEYSADINNAWAFSLYAGVQVSASKLNGFFAMVVRDGDVAAQVPEPSTLLLLGSGLAGLAVLRKRLKG